MTLFWSVLKVVGVFAHIILVVVLLFSCNPWSDFGIGAMLESPRGKVGLGCFLLVLGIAYYKTAFAHAVSKAFEICGWMFVITGLLIAAWGIWPMFFGLDWLNFHVWWSRLFLFFVLIQPNVVGGSFNEPPKT